MALVRSRVAGLVLIVAPLGSLASDLAPSEDAGLLGFWARVLVLCAWLPAMQSLEHFLKRRSEIGSLALVGLATLGIVGRLLALVLRTTAAPGEYGGRLQLSAAWLASLFPLALLGCGLGFLRWRCAPPLSGFVLALGGLLATWHALAPVRGLPLLANACMAFACGRIGLGLLRDPRAWEPSSL
jgi:hypothetical protein